jgi:hypothetical protein
MNPELNLAGHADLRGFFKLSQPISHTTCGILFCSGWQKQTTINCRVVALYFCEVVLFLRNLIHFSDDSLIKIVYT